MAKFKVGDKVNCADYGNGVITKIITSVMPEIPYYVVFESGKELYLGADRLTLPVAREFIVIHRSGNVMTAEHRVNREVIKSAKATCAPSDTFDFGTGAKLAFDRLMNRQNIEEAVKAWNEPAPAPEPPKFYTGKVVCISGEYGVGRIFTVKDGFFADRHYNCPEKPYKSVDDMNDRFLFGKFAEAKE